MQLAFRPHHFLCTLCFQGRGYSPAFVANFQAIVETIQANPALPITVINQTDAICQPCPHRLETKCQTEDKIQRLDNAHAKALDLNTGDTLSWDQAKVRIKEKITLPLFHQICKSCNWKKLGVCESVLTEFL